MGLGGGGVLPPLLLENGNTVETRRKLLRKCIHALEEICNRLGIDRYTVKDRMLYPGMSVWMQLCLENGSALRGIDSECYVDLSLDEQEILGKIRRTNKYSIQKSHQLWKSEIVTRESGRERVEECFEKFRRLHAEVSGRVTRSRETWDIQCEAMFHTNDFLVLLYDTRETMIGASLYSTSGSTGSYSVAAYKRELFDKPVGHVGQWLAIQQMKKLGLKWYYIGRRGYPGDWKQPTEKEISIGHFKEGFATHMYPSVFLECRIKNEAF